MKRGRRILEDTSPYELTDIVEKTEKDGIIIFKGVV